MKMAERLQLDTSSDMAALSEIAAAALRDGQLIIAPMEHAYIFVADAFNHGAVKKMHILRGDSLGVAAQVLVGDLKMARGITHEFSGTLTQICERFWPGLLTVKIAPAQGLVWNLGDDRTLEQIAIRVPASEFLRSVALATGPLAVASAATTGAAPRRKSGLFPVRESEYAYLFDAGELPEGEVSTVIAANGDGITLTRAGAITLAELREVTPNIAVPA